MPTFPNSLKMIFHFLKPSFVICSPPQKLSKSNTKKWKNKFKKWPFNLKFRLWTVKPKNPFNFMKPLTWDLVSWSLVLLIPVKLHALTFWPCHLPECTKSKCKTKFLNPNSETSKDTLSIQNPSQWVSFMVKSMSWLKNGTMALPLQSWGSAHKKKILSQTIGSFSTGLSMLFGLKTWTLCLMTTWCFALQMVKESSLLLPWECCLKSWILRLHRLPLSPDAAWFIWSVKTFLGNRSCSRRLMHGVKKWKNWTKMMIIGRMTWSPTWCKCSKKLYQQYRLLSERKQSNQLSPQRLTWEVLFLTYFQSCVI